MVKNGNRRADLILQNVRTILDQQGGVRLEYASLCHPETLEEVPEVTKPTLLAIAAWVGEVRLIDNRVIG
jgi:pantothenate synthetase